VALAVGFATVLLLALACAGGGHAILRALALDDRLEPRLVDPLAFVLGVGLLGWLVMIARIAPLQWAAAGHVRTEPAPQ